MTHLAETKEEGEFLAKGTGPLMDLVRERGWLKGKWEPPGKSPVEYLAGLEVLGRGTLLAHLNYPSPSDIELVAKSGASVAFCPRSHRFFRHEPYPLNALLSARINVCLGTDSLASNESLSLLEEARMVAKDFPHLSPSLIFAMSTANGAVSLGLGGKIGVIARGAWANLLLLNLAPLGARLEETSLLESLLRGKGEPLPLEI
jgi:cytosine/adenosine deaminase-related metal-dependent hydrolase